MRRLPPECDQLARESALNNAARMWEANEAIVQLVKECISKMTTTMNKQLQVVAKSQPAAALGQPGVPTAQGIIPALVLALGAPVQWCPAMADPNPGPVSQKGLVAINQPEAQGQVIPCAVAAQAQLVTCVVRCPPQPQVRGKVVPIVPPPGQVPPDVVPGQLQPEAQGEGLPIVLVPGQVAPGVVLGQPQPQEQGQVVTVSAGPGPGAPCVVPGQSHQQAQEQVVHDYPKLSPGQLALYQWGTVC